MWDSLCFIQGVGIAHMSNVLQPQAVACITLTTVLLWPTTTSHVHGFDDALEESANVDLYAGDVEITWRLVLFDVVHRTVLWNSFA